MFNVSCLLIYNFYFNNEILSLFSLINIHCILILNLVILKHLNLYFKLYCFKKDNSYKIQAYLNNETGISSLTWNALI